MAKEDSADTIAARTFWLTMAGAVVFIGVVAVFILSR
jgi:hypothetical protein